MTESEITISLHEVAKGGITDAIELWRGIYESSLISSTPSKDESMDESND